MIHFQSINFINRFYGHIFIVFLVILIPPFFFLNALSDDQHQNTLIIRVGAYDNHPKIYTDQSGKIVGLFPDVLNYIAQKEGWILQYVQGSWSECLTRLTNNDIDLMVDVAFSEQRANQYTFSNETFLVNWATVYTNRTQKIDSLIDLNGKKVAVMKGSIHTDGDGGIKKLATKFDIACHFVEVSSYQNVFELLSNNNVDAGIVNRLFGSLHSDSYDVKKTPIIFNPRHIKFAFPKDSAIATILIKKIDYHLYEMKKDPDSIYNKALYIYLSGLPRELIFSKPDVPTEGQPISLTLEEKKWIHNHPIIRLGIDPEFAPFEYITSEGLYSGITLEYIRILNQRLGLNMQVVKNISWKEAIELSKLKEIDVLPCICITQDRKKYLKFSKPYINFHRAIITRTDTPFLSGLRDIENMTVAVQLNSSHEGYLRENTSIKPIIYETLQKALLAISDGQVDAFVGNIASSTYWIRKLNLTNLKIAAPVSQEIQNLHFAVRDDWPELIYILNKGLKSISHEEENTIRKRWINIEYKPGISPRQVFRYILQIASLAIVIILIFLLWNYRLKQEINKRIEIDKKLSEANKSLKKLDQLKSMFIASMSHELRTPLNSIIGFTGIIIQGMTGPLNDKQKDHLSRVYNSAKHLLALISDVIDISKIEAGRIDIYPEDIILSDLFNEAIMTIEPQLKTKKLTLTQSFPEELQLHTDRKRLLQCIINYLSNAVKYTETGSISITARQCEENLEILVTDTGIGIPEKDKEKLFEAFERLDSRLKIKAGGTGLGLYLVRKLVTDILGGTIIMKSQEGKGSTFGLLIPMHLSIDKKQNNGNVL